MAKMRAMLLAFVIVTILPASTGRAAPSMPAPASEECAGVGNATGIVNNLTKTAVVNRTGALAVEGLPTAEPEEWITPARPPTTAPPKKGHVSGGAVAAIAIVVVLSLTFTVTVTVKLTCGRKRSSAGAAATGEVNIGV